MEIITDYVIPVFQVLFRNLVFLNIVFAVIIVFFQRREPKSVWTWLLLLYFIPILGFVFYLLIGTDMHKRKMFKTKGIEDRLNDAIRQQEHQIRNRELERQVPEITGYADLVMYNLDTMGTVLSDDNDLRILTDGNDKFEALLEDIRNAKEFIHFQYYIIKNDVVFSRILEALLEKVREGVEVRILFDAMGCRFVSHRFWKELELKGIKIAEFFPAFLRKFHLRINYRNHRKIVVIDNKTAYVGGFNVAKEYVGLDKKFGYWRDTHLRIMGSAVMGLSMRFLLDWNYAARENLFSDSRYLTGAVPGTKDRCEIQIISSGPDAQEQTIRDNYVRLIHKARKSIYIQTPYFIPDEAMLTAL